MRDKEERLGTRDRKGREEKKKHESERQKQDREERQREEGRKKEKREKHEGLFLVGLQEPASVWLGLRKV